MEKKIHSVGNYCFDENKTIETIENYEFGKNYEVVTPFVKDRTLDENLKAAREYAQKLGSEGREYIIADSKHGFLFFIMTDEPGNKELASDGIIGTHIPDNWIHALILTTKGERICGRRYFAPIGKEE